MNLIEHLNSLLSKKNESKNDFANNMISNKDNLKEYLANLVEAEGDDEAYKKDGITYIKRKKPNEDGYTYTKKEGNGEEQPANESDFNNAKDNGGEQTEVPPAPASTTQQTTPTTPQTPEPKPKDDDLIGDVEYKEKNGDVVKITGKWDPEQKKTIYTKEVNGQKQNIDQESDDYTKLEKLAKSIKKEKTNKENKEIELLASNIVNGNNEKTITIKDEDGTEHEKVVKVDNNGKELKEQPSGFPIFRKGKRGEDGTLPEDTEPGAKEVFDEAHSAAIERAKAVQKQRNAGIDSAEEYTENENGETKHYMLVKRGGTSYKVPVPPPNERDEDWDIKKAFDANSKKITNPEALKDKIEDFKQQQQAKKEEKEKQAREEAEKNAKEKEKAEFDSSKAERLKTFEEDGEKMYLVKKGNKTFKVNAKAYDNGEWTPNFNDKDLDKVALDEIDKKAQEYEKSHQVKDQEEEKEAATYRDGSGNQVKVIKYKSGKVVVQKLKKDGESWVADGEPEVKNDDYLKWAKGKEATQRELDDTPPAKDMEDGETVTNDETGTQIKAYKDGDEIKYKVIKGKKKDGGGWDFDDPESEEKIDKDDALKTVTCMRNNASKDLIAQALHIDKSEPPLQYTSQEKDPQSGEIITVTRERSVDTNGNPVFRTKRGDSDWEEEKAAAAQQLFDAAKENQAKAEIAATQIPEEIKMPKDLKGENIVDITDDEGNVTRTVKDAKGKIYQWKIPKDKLNDKDFEPEIKTDLPESTFTDAKESEKEQRKKNKKEELGEAGEEAEVLNDNGSKTITTKYINPETKKVTYITQNQKLNKETGKWENDGPAETHYNSEKFADAKAINKKQLEDSRKEEESNIVPEEFEFNDGEKQVKYKSEKDSDGKIHYYEIGENGEKKEISPESFKKGKELHDKDIERARKLKQDAEDRQLELQKKREDKIIDGKEEKSEPSEFKKSLDTVIDKMMGSDNLIGNLLGGVFKVSLGLMSTITGKMKKKDVGVDAMMLANLQDKLDNVDLTELDDKTKAVLDAVKNQNTQLLGAMYDENGKLRSPEEIQKALKRNMSDEEWNEYKKKIQEGADATKNIKGVDDALALPESEEEIAALEAKAHEMSAEGKKVNDILDKKRKDEAESNKKFNDKMDEIAEQRASEEDSLKNYKNEVDNIQTELDNIKQEDGESDEQFAGRKKKLMVRLEKAQKQYDDASKEVKEKYDKQEEDAIKERQEERQKIEKEYQDAMKEAGFETVEARAEAQTKAKKEKADQEDRESIDTEDEENKKDIESSEDEETDGEEDPTKEPQNPAKVWKHRKKKNGKGMTANYYNKKGDSISSDEFKEKEAKYQERLKKWQQKNGGTNNESLQDYLSLRLSNDNIAHRITINEYLVESQK